MNKKGFTLIELLIVIAVVVSISVSSTIAVMNVLENSKKNRLDTVVNEIIEASDVYLNSSDSLKDKLYNCGDSSCNINITLGTLQSALLVSYNIKNPQTNEEFSSMTYVSITYNSSTGSITSEFIY